MCIVVVDTMVVVVVVVGKINEIKNCNSSPESSKGYLVFSIILCSNHQLTQFAYCILYIFLKYSSTPYLMV